jgi:hypothetical protein
MARFALDRAPSRHISAFFLLALVHGIKESQADGTMDDERGYDEIEAQIGRAAGNIAATNFRHHVHLTEVVSDAARSVQTSLRSEWTLVEIWNNGMTIWQSPEGGQTVSVMPGGEMQAFMTDEPAG